ncbi:MAG: fused MFS/spermidine synthase [Humidesulfovibrio sp.]|uniref:fused MFS/spermidine synthase n=1 Tax=Humidesulfovibrio sp. TaxID=2910988 RepID=UPI0027346C73|nr:fused MFS/spermidine synthase [Humidesulfovibrio sp.]MDP2847877.1 fused MFS/spermidine synthase [Humidesulfovibrio sp.]
MLEIAVFLCGAVVMVLELTGSRVLAPFLGTSIIVWTSLIGVVLGSLSIGCWWGGRVADKRPDPKLLSRIILLAAVATLLIAGLKGFLLAFLQNRAGLTVATLASTVALFVPVSVLLGMVSPFAVRLRMHDAKHSGRTAGNLYALSTLGSIAGTFAAGFWLTATIGSTNIVLSMAGVLIMAAFCVHRGDLPAKLAALVLTALVTLGLSIFDSQLQAAEIHDLDTPYQRVLVFNARNTRTGMNMRVLSTGPEGNQSAVDLSDPTRLALPYTRYYRLAAHFRQDIKNVLMLGGGGYSFPKYAMSRPDEFGGSPHMDVVEIDPGVTDIATKFFGLTPMNGLTLHHDDARRFLNRDAAPGSYQVALVDVFTSHLSVPFHLATRETAKALSRSLDADGVVLVNCISAAEGPKSRFYRALLATYRSVFPHVESFLLEPEDPTSTQNIILAAFKSAEAPNLSSKDPEYAAMLAMRYTPAPARPGDPPVLTDEFAPVDHYLLNL